MQLTTEQERAVMRGASRHADMVRRAMAGARRAIFGACSACWYNGARCRGNDCPLARIAESIAKCGRMLDHGKLAPNWYIEAKNAATLAEVPFNNEIESEVTK